MIWTSSYWRFTRSPIYSFLFTSLQEVFFEFLDIVEGPIELHLHIIDSVTDSFNLVRDFIRLSLAPPPNLRMQVQNACAELSEQVVVVSFELIC